MKNPLCISFTHIIFLDMVNYGVTILDEV